MAKIAMLGDGSFGTAIASVLAHNGHDVNLWCHNPLIAQSIQNSRINCVYFPEHVLSERIQATTNISTALDAVDFIFQAIPMAYLPGVLQKLKQINIASKKIWISLTKGIDNKTLHTASQLMQNNVPELIRSLVIVSGPSFAREILDKGHTGFMVASGDMQSAELIQNLIKNEYIHTAYTDDVIGVEYLAALKNVYAIGMGLLQLSGNNPQALFMTAAVKELTAFLACMGNKETISSVAGIGDLMLTCYSMQSRNVQAGSLIAQGKSPEEIQTLLKNLPEGIHTLHTIPSLEKKYELSLSLARTILSIIHDHADSNILIQSLRY